MKTQFNYEAIRALETALQRNERLKAQEEAARCDGYYDGGEWSDAFHDEAIRFLQLQVAARVAQRFGMSSRELMDQMFCAAQQEQWEEQKARQDVRPGWKRALIPGWEKVGRS